MMKMEFKLLLAIIDRMCPADAEFDSRSLYRYAARHLTTFSLNTHITAKLISNDLNRLYRMQLVSRRKVKRPTAMGNSYRGFMYAYNLNKQGRSYVNYLKQTLFHPEFQDYFRKAELRTNFVSAISINHIENTLGENLDDLDEAFAEYVYLFSGAAGGRYKRFPARISFEFVKELMEKKWKLEEENQSLQADLEACRRELKAARQGRIF